MDGFTGYKTATAEERSESESWRRVEEAAHAVAEWSAELNRRLR